MVHLTKKQKTISIAASLVAASLALAPTSAKAGPQPGSIAAAKLVAAVRSNVGNLQTATPHSLAILRLAQWGSTVFPVLATPMLAKAARTSLKPSTPEKLTTRAVPRAVFSSVALPIRNIPAAAQWGPAYASLGQDLASECSAAECFARATRLQAVIDHARSARFTERLHLINLAVNRMISYASDSQVYGRLDYWATPSQALKAGRGDCEDYAILKMAALKAAGIPASSMSLVVLRDRERDLFHAVLAVATDKGHFILDNVHDAVLPDSRIARYQPLYSMSGERYWLHGTKRSGDRMVAGGTGALRNIAPGEGPDATMR